MDLKRQRAQLEFSRNILKELHESVRLGYYVPRPEIQRWERRVKDLQDGLDRAGS